MVPVVGSGVAKRERERERGVKLQKLGIKEMKRILYYFFIV